MKNRCISKITLEIMVGAYIDETINEALDLKNKLYCDVEFEFNGYVFELKKDEYYSVKELVEKYRESKNDVKNDKEGK